MMSHQTLITNNKDLVIHNVSLNSSCHFYVFVRASSFFYYHFFLLLQVIHQMAPLGTNLACLQLAEVSRAVEQTVTAACGDSRG